MPSQAQWDAFFDAEKILDELRLDASTMDVLEFGCGYGTFTLPAARRIRGKVIALDLDPVMVETTRKRAEEAGLDNVDCHVRDFVADGSGVADASVDYAMLFNILHGENPGELLLEARRSLRPGGLLGVIHWNHDTSTPRGPPMDIRPRPGQCLAWALSAGFSRGGDIVELPPYHYGFVVIA